MNNKKFPKAKAGILKCHNYKTKEIEFTMVPNKTEKKQQILTLEAETRE